MSDLNYYYDASQISESSTTASYADARADFTPTIEDDGQFSGSEDTLSNLSLEEIIPDVEELVVDHAGSPSSSSSPCHSGNNHDQKIKPDEIAVLSASSSTSFASALNSSNVKVCVTDEDLKVMMMTMSGGEGALDLPPGAEYVPTSVDFPKSPSQLKILKGPEFMPKEEEGLVGGLAADDTTESEDLSSSIASTYQTYLDSNGDVRIQRKEDEVKHNSHLASSSPCNNQFVPHLSNNNHNEDKSLSMLDDYIEDFILPLSHESVMQRQKSFRKKVKKTYDELAMERASKQEIDKLDRMLDTYSEEEEELDDTFRPQPKPRFDLSSSQEPQSLLDIDAIIEKNAPNLMHPQIHESMYDDGSLMSSSYALPTQTLEKLQAVYESSNFNKIYCLSGEIKNILSPVEIEELLGNREQLQGLFDKDLVDVLESLSVVNNTNTRESSESGIESPTESDESASSSSKSRNSHTDEDRMDEVDLLDEGTEDNNNNDNGTCLIRRDSKRFSFNSKKGKNDEERVIEGLFEESKNSNPFGTLRRVKVPLDLTRYDLDSPEDEEKELPPLKTDANSSTTSPKISSTDEAKSKRNTTQPSTNNQRRRIAVDENVLSMISSSTTTLNDLDEDLDLDASQATNVNSKSSSEDVFYSIQNNSTLKEDLDQADSDEMTLSDINTINDEEDDYMEDSIIGQLESMPPHLQPKPSIDLHSISPYRRCISHGGYLDAEKSISIILFSACYLPSRTQPDYTHLMDHLFLYALQTLEELVVEDYILVYLQGATPKSSMPSYTWLKKAYQLVNYRLKKNLKGLYLVHPNFWLRACVGVARFVSGKFSRKIRFMNTLSDLCLEIPTEHLAIPEDVLQYDFLLKVEDLKRKKLMN